MWLVWSLYSIQYSILVQSFPIYEIFVCVLRKQNVYIFYEFLKILQWRCLFFKWVWILCFWKVGKPDFLIYLLNFLKRSMTSYWYTISMQIGAENFSKIGAVIGRGNLFCINLTFHVQHTFDQLKCWKKINSLFELYKRVCFYFELF